MIISPIVAESFRLKKIARSPKGSKVLKRLYGISGLMDLDGLFDPVREAGRLLNLNLEKSTDVKN